MLFPLTCGLLRGSWLATVLAIIQKQHDGLDGPDPGWFFLGNYEGDR